MKLITFLMFFTQIATAMSGRQMSNSHAKTFTPVEIDNAWIKVPWTSGGFYFHNTLTREDIDDYPQCLSGKCNFRI